MKRKVLSFLVCVMLLNTCFSALAMNFVPEEIYRSVFVIYTDNGAGSGFAVDRNTVITNAHVVGGSKYVTVRGYDGSSLKGEVVRINEDRDMALISVDAELKAVTISENDISIGQEVYAVGAPRDMPYTMTKGIVSAPERTIGANSYIQIDASVNSGNSGGPLLNENGEVIGIITLKANDAEGIGFAGPAREINAFISGAELPPSSDGSSSAPQTMPDENEAEKRISALSHEIALLRFLVIVLLALLVLAVFAAVRSRRKQRNGKKKDEFDFEIEIEEIT